MTAGYVLGLAIEELKVGGIVVGWIAIFVVDYFFGQQDAAKMRLHHKTMLEDIWRSGVGK